MVTVHGTNVAFYVIARPFSKAVAISIVTFWIAEPVASEAKQSQDPSLLRHFVPRNRKTPRNDRTNATYTP